MVLCFWQLQMKALLIDPFASPHCEIKNGIITTLASSLCTSRLECSSLMFVWGSIFDRKRYCT
eukprot:m.1343998 g.1343998  ORF g.1343998 m.1343998 type:complete len:63 (+) comp24901_c1_seq60:1-189(+)